MSSPIDCAKLSLIHSVRVMLVPDPVRNSAKEDDQWAGCFI